MTGHINPERAQFQAFKDLPRGTVLHMLNLVRVRARADYADAQAASGHDAYLAYGVESAPVLARVGGSILWRGAFETTLIGPADERWDFAFIARYPDAHAFLAMLADPEYQQAVRHRTAAVEDSRLIRLGALEGGAAFAG